MGKDQTMTDLPAMLEPPAMPQPAARVNQHGNHWDAHKYETNDGGWTWIDVSGVNFATEAAANEWAGL